MAEKSKVTRKGLVGLLHEVEMLGPFMANQVSSCINRCERPRDWRRLNPANPTPHCTHFMCVESCNRHLVTKKVRDDGGRE